MGITDKVTGGLRVAIRKGEQSTHKYVSKLIDQNDEIIEKLNWIMVTQQALCDKQGVKLKDPLETEDKK